jgi:F0F1-type ATP synthase assembly protein I
VGGKDAKEKYRLYRQLSLLAVIPAVMAVGPLIGFFIGRWLDNKLGTEPYLMIAFITFGFVAAGKEIYGIVKRVSNESDD